MPSCEKCWADAHRDPYKSVVEEYERLVKERTCTPEEQAGPDASICFRCNGIRTIHQHCGICMSCGFDASVCRNCGDGTPRKRWNYATPICYECLPAPEPLPIAPMASQAAGSSTSGSGTSGKTATDPVKGVTGDGSS